MPSIKIPTPLRAYTDGQSQLTIDGATVGDVLQNLVAQFPDLEQHLFNDGELRNFVNIFLGEDDVRFLDGLDTPLDADDNLRIIPSIAGGCCC